MKNLIRILSSFSLLLLMIFSTLLPIQASSIDGKADLAANHPLSGVNYRTSALFYEGGTDAIYFNSVPSTATPVSVYKYTVSTNTWSALSTPPYDSGVAANLPRVSATTTSGIAWNAVHTSANHGVVYRWEYITDTYTSWGDIGALSTLNTTVFEDETNDLLHVLATIGGVITDKTHSSTNPAGGWTDNGGSGTIAPSCYFHTRTSTGIHYWFKQNDSTLALKFTEASQTYSTPTTTVVGGIPPGGLHGIFNNGDSIYALFFATSSPTDYRNTNWQPQIYKYTDGVGWNFYSDQWDFGGSINLTGAIFSSTWAQDIGVIDNIVYIMPFKSSIEGTGGSIVKMMRVYGLTSSSNITQFRPNTALGTATTVGSVTSILWESPRVLFQDEQTGFAISGTANLVIKPQIVDELGNVIVATVNLQIATAGVWYWNSINLPTSAIGHFIKCVDTVGGVSSIWGYVTYPKVSGFSATKSYSKYLDNQEYTRSVSDYIASSTQLCIFAYSTTLTTTDLTLYKLRIMQNSSTADTTYTITLSDLNSSYFQTNYSSNNGMAVTRYILAIFNMSSGSNTYDGLVTNFSRDYITTPAYEGFYEPAIVDSATGLTRLTTTQSVYYYCNSTFVFKVTMSKSLFTPSEKFDGSVDVYSTGFFTPFDTVKWRITESNGVTVVVGPYTITDRLLKTIISSYVPANGGTFYFDTYMYYSGDAGIFKPHARFKFVVVGSGSEAVTNPIKSTHEWLASFSLDNMMGTWGLTLLVSIVLFAFCVIIGKAHTLSLIIGACCFLGTWGLGIVTGFVDIWLVILLAVGAGVTLFAIILKKTTGGGNDV